jgi:hypothetical protein
MPHHNLRRRSTTFVDLRRPRERAVPGERSNRGALPAPSRRLPLPRPWQSEMSPLWAPEDVSQRSQSLQAAPEQQPGRATIVKNLRRPSETVRRSHPERKKHSKCGAAGPDRGALRPRHLPFGGYSAPLGRASPTRRSSVRFPEPHGSSGEPLTTFADLRRPPEGTIESERNTRGTLTVSNDAPFARREIFLEAVRSWRGDGCSAQASSLHPPGARRTPGGGGEPSQTFGDRVVGPWGGVGRRSSADAPPLRAPARPARSRAKFTQVGPKQALPQGTRRLQRAENTVWRGPK